jgi:hypothetical protein
MAGAKAVESTLIRERRWGGREKNDASLHLCCFFKCECVLLMEPTINPTAK